MQEITNHKHKTFADEFILTGEAVASYQKAYPKSKSESARVESYKLLQNPTTANYIKVKQLEIQNARQNNVLNELKSKDSSNILKREKIVEMQSNVTKIAYNQFIKSKDKQDAELFIKAVESLNKLEGYHKATKTEVAISEVKPIELIEIFAKTENTESQ
jgi:phage terminase small subunit